MTKSEITNCYTYEVTMLVQVLAEDEETASAKLDRDGGYITKREVVLKDTISLYSGLN